MPKANVVVLLCLLVGAPILAGADTADRIVAIVNDEAITEADVTGHVEVLNPQDLHGTSAPSAASMRDAVLQQLIEQRLLLQEAKRQGMTVTNEEVDAELEDVRRRFHSDEEFEQSLTDAGLSRERFKEQIRERLLVRHAVDAKVRAAITVSPQEVASEFAAHPVPANSGDRVHVRDLLIRIGERHTEVQARALIENLARRLARGEEFAALAKRHSEDASADDGGDMGWISPGTMMPELEVALAALQAGQISPPVKTSLGYHLLKVEERAPAGQQDSVKANAGVYQAIYQRKFRETMRRWLDELKRQAYIEIVPLPSG